MYAYNTTSTGVARWRERQVVATHTYLGAALDIQTRPLVSRTSEETMTSETGSPLSPTTNGRRRQGCPRGRTQEGGGVTGPASNYSQAAVQSP